MNSGIKSVLLYCKYIAKIAQIFAPVRIIAVMFTFSFSSAFAVVDWTGETASKYLTDTTDYLIDASAQPDPKKDGDEGITEAYRAELTKEAKAELKFVKGSNTPFYAPEKTEAVSLIEAYIENLKTVKTAKAANALKADLTKAVGTWNGTATTITEVTDTAGAVTSLKQKATVQGEAFHATTGIAAAKAATDGAAAGSAVIDLTRVVSRAAGKNLYLPGYTTLKAAANIGSANVLQFGSNATAGAIFKTGYAADPVQKAVVDWFLDNDYRVLADFSTGAKAFMNALVIVNDDYIKTVNAEKDPIVNEIWKYSDKAADARKGLPATDAEGIDALVKKINDFNKKYAGLDTSTSDTALAVIGDAEKADLVTAINGAKGFAFNYFGQYETELAALPAVKQMTDADKAKVQELYKKVNALLDSYEDTWTFHTVNITEVNKDLAYNYDVLKAGYEKFLKADVKAFKNLDEFTEYKKAGAKAYFDASEKNVNALKAQRTAFDALVSGYGYADLNEVGAAGGMTFGDAANYEAKILAAEHNMTADAEYDVKDNTKVQAYLNNATVKVTTKALGNTKIRVNAKIDTVSFEKILGEMEAGSTVTYKFYHKTAKATAYKASKEKDRNYITYTKKSLKKGTKYKFQCEVIIKDANGNVVATKDYKASTIGSRVCR